MYDNHRLLDRVYHPLIQQVARLLRFDDIEVNIVELYFYFEGHKYNSHDDAVHTDHGNELVRFMKACFVQLDLESDNEHNRRC